MDITVYLPDEIGARAKDAGLNLSGLLREAVTGALDRREVVEAAVTDMAERRVETSEGRFGDSPVILRFTGKQLAGDSDVTVIVWLIEDGRVLLEDRESYSVFADAEEFAAWVEDWQRRDNLGGSSEATLRDAVVALGIVPVVDL